MKLFRPTTTVKSTAASGGYNYKVTEDELRRLVPPAAAEDIMAAARAREPGQWSKETVSYPLNRPGTVYVQNVEFYGGENFDKPYAFPAEIRHRTTESAFSACTRRLGIRLRIPFTY